MQAAITIDVDSLRFYRQIHGLPEVPGPDPIYDVALPRFYELLSEVGVPATLFLIGEDAAARPEAFQPLARLGCEVASHSHRHDYRLTEKSEEAIEAELRAADQALRPLSPVGSIVGFRAPGYNTSPALLRAVLKLGYRYDSSLLPSPPYFLARAAVIGRYRLGHQPSRSLVGRWSAFAGPLHPYWTTPEHPDRPSPDGALLELPMAVEPTSRVHLIGTTWVLFPKRLRDRLLGRALSQLQFFNFEMHGIDLLDRTDPGVDSALVRAQPDLRIGVSSKMDAFRSLFRRLRASADVLTLATVAAGLHR